MSSPNAFGSPTPSSHPSMTSGSSAGTPQVEQSAERLDLLLNNGPYDEVYIAGQDDRVRRCTLYAEIDIILTQFQFGARGQGGNGDRQDVIHEQGLGNDHQVLYDLRDPIDFIFIAAQFDAVE